jgi:hypothetical protein
MGTHLLALAATLTLTTLPGAAWATGMQGHIYMAQCGAELSQNPRVKQIVAAHPMMLANGGILPDSGYTTSDYDQGEIPHWEQYVEGFVEQLRERHGGADAPESWANVAVLFGLSAHGITDSTFDTLFFPRVEQEDRPEDIDLAADVLYVALTRKKFIPDVVLDTTFASDVFQNKISHDVTKDEIFSAMKTARSGIGATVLIAKSPGFYEKNYPWERRSLLDPRVPGAYAFGSRMVARYYDELLRRLDGNTSADGAVIGTYPRRRLPHGRAPQGPPRRPHLLLLRHRHRAGVPRWCAPGDRPRRRRDPRQGWHLPRGQVGQRAPVRPGQRLDTNHDLHGATPKYLPHAPGNLPLSPLGIYLHYLLSGSSHRRVPRAAGRSSVLALPDHRQNRRRGGRRQSRSGR